MMRNLRLIAISSLGLVSLLAFNNCSGPESAAPDTIQALPQTITWVPKGSRILAMDTNDAAQDFNFIQSFAAAQSVGVGAGTLHLNWNTDEGAGSGTTSGTFTDTYSALASANAFYANTTPVTQVSLTLAPIDTTGPALPSDLAGLAMDNATVITRFNKFIDWVLLQTPGTSFTSIQIGNEIDVTNSASTALFWSQYKTFLTAVVAHLHSVKPGVKVGVTVTLYGLTGQGTNGSVASLGVQSLLSTVDDLGLTYYPLDANFMVKDPGVVAADFDSVFQLTGTTPVYFQEVGYPTSNVCGGSESAQGAFIYSVFKAWDKYADHIPFISILRLNDYSPPAATAMAANYGLSGNAAFVGYLQTLGLRTYTSPSVNKSAWDTLKSEASYRGW